MQIVFRADASIDQGTGHVMRCLSLARHLMKAGHQCAFITQAFLPEVIEKISSAGCKLHYLPEYLEAEFDEISSENYLGWLKRPIMNDAFETCAILRKFDYDIIIADHYAINAVWMEKVQENVRKTVIIDDLANRSHLCDLLIDQNYGRSKHDYFDVVPSSTILLVGTEYVFIDENFYRLRANNIKERLNRLPRVLNVCLGGIDKDNATLEVLKTLEKIKEIQSWKIEVILQSASPNIQEITDYIDKMTIETYIFIDCKDMAAAFSRADLAIGAGGVTLWERCCLGLPSVLVTIADNQKPAAYAISRTSAVEYCGDIRDKSWSKKLKEIIKLLAKNSSMITSMSLEASKICDGKGLYKVCNEIQTL